LVNEQKSHVWKPAPLKDGKRELLHTWLQDFTTKEQRSKLLGAQIILREEARGKDLTTNLTDAEKGKHRRYSTAPAKLLSEKTVQSSPVTETKPAELEKMAAARADAPAVNEADSSAHSSSTDAGNIRITVTPPAAERGVPVAREAAEPSSDSSSSASTFKADAKESSEGSDSDPIIPVDPEREEKILDEILRKEASRQRFFRKGDLIKVNIGGGEWTNGVVSQVVAKAWEVQFKEDPESELFDESQIVHAYGVLDNGQYVEVYSAGRNKWISAIVQDWHEDVKKYVVELVRNNRTVLIVDDPEHIRAVDTGDQPSPAAQAWGAYDQPCEVRIGNVVQVGRRGKHDGMLMGFTRGYRIKFDAHDEVDSEIRNGSYLQLRYLPKKPTASSDSSVVSGSQTESGYDSSQTESSYDDIDDITVLVTGAGTEAANGFYQRMSIERNERPQYQKKDSNGCYNIYYNNNYGNHCWTLSKPDGSILYQGSCIRSVNQADDMIPPTTGWKTHLLADRGASPAPTLEFVEY